MIKIITGRVVGMDKVKKMTKLDFMAELMIDQEEIVLTHSINLLALRAAVAALNPKLWVVCAVVAHNGADFYAYKIQVLD